MKGYLTVMTGTGSGGRKDLMSPLIIVGRSKNADMQIEDELVSRRHLEIRTDADAVFVENKSSQGSLLNGKPLVGVVSLNPGDELQIGGTKLRYDEADEKDSSAAVLAGSPVEAVSASVDGTKGADLAEEMRRQEKADPPPEATRAMVDGETRMLKPDEVPNWAAPEKIEKRQANKSSLALAGFIAFLLTGGVAVWLYATGHKQESSGMIQYKDALYQFSLQRPLDWDKTSDDANTMGFGFGKEGEGDWGRLTIYTDRDVKIGLTGLTDGFSQYEDILKKRYPEFELLGNQVMHVNNCTVMFYAFSTHAVEGKGIYVLNGDSRIVVEGFSSLKCYPTYAPVFSTLLQGFRMSDYEPQQFFDFPPPDEGMQQLALANPTELTRQVDEYIRRGDLLLASPYVNPDNLYKSVQAYRKALQLARASTQEPPEYAPAAKGLAQATLLFNQSLDRQRFEINRALKEGDNNTAYWEANKMMQMVPDKVDPAYQEAYRVSLNLKPPEQ
jgi:pSer/pThr/pTyr-binding forkhead associated (FHA) protein